MQVSWCSASLSGSKLWVRSPALHETGLGVYTRNPSSQEEEAEGSKVQGHSRLHSGPEASLGHTKTLSQNSFPPKEKRGGIPGVVGALLDAATSSTQKLCGQSTVHP